MEHYLDNSATTKVCPEAAQAALAAMTECYGNPSSTHTRGREAKKLLDTARGQAAAALGCRPGEVVFTSCGSESDNWALLSGAEAMARKGRHIISALVHTDAVQAFMKLPFSPKSLGADMISVSGHKIHAPKGIGALYVRDGLRLRPYIMGGAQEGGRRAGTEAMPAIAAFGAACDAARADMAGNIARMAAFKCEIVERLGAAIPEFTWLDTPAPHILSISLPGWRSEVLMNFLEAREVYVSKSSACKKGGRSHVLEAIGMKPAAIDGALRIGLSRLTVQEDIDALCEGLIAAHGSLAHR